MAVRPMRRTAVLGASAALCLRLAAFERYLVKAVRERAGGPGRMGLAVRYAALSPGKRLRPLLSLTACDAVGGDWRRALPAAVAIECVHAFSLVHDDLPAMDDDDFRRGRLTTHKKFGEAIGILTGDALLAFAFEELARLAAVGVPSLRVVEAVQRLGRAAGADELVGGQALDIAAEGRRTGARGVREIHTRKTGALMGCALALGALAGDAGAATVQRLDDSGRKLGLAFQIHDDLLNSGSSLKTLGKRVGTDAARGKATFPAAVGESSARAEAARLIRVVEAAIGKATQRPELLLELIGATARRDK
ncbi:MAG: polyprenyl synthetase family protein [Candidatus Eisenbacteria bacterium]